MSGTIELIRHRAGALSLRLGLGLNMRPVAAIQQLQLLLDHHSSWAQGRSAGMLRRMLCGSQVVVSAWQGRRLVGFGRATSDGVLRAVLWDVIVAEDCRGQGLGRQIVQKLLAAAAVRSVERTYLMTTSSEGFYLQLGFQSAESQRLLRLERPSEDGGH